MLKLLFNNPQNLNLNFKNIDGNRTGSALYQAFSKILEISGHESINFKKSADEIVEQVKRYFLLWVGIRKFCVLIRKRIGQATLL